MGRQPHRGHFCWCCGEMRPNEAFSGAGHARHLCNRCSKSGDEELRFRRERRNIDGLLGWNGLIGRRNKETFARYLSHPEPRVRAYAAEIAAHDAQERKRLSDEERAIELHALSWQDDCPESTEAPVKCEDDSDIPF